MNDSSNPDATTQRHARRLAALETRVDDLEGAARRVRALGPLLLLVLANVTPLVVVTPRSDPSESYTLFQLLRDAVGVGGPTGLWFVLLVLAGLGAAVAAGLLWSSSPSAGARWFVLGVAVVLLLLLLALIVVTASAGTRNSSYTADPGDRAAAACRDMADRRRPEQPELKAPGGDATCPSVLRW